MALPNSAKRNKRKEWEKKRQHQRGDANENIRDTLETFLDFSKKYFHQILINCYHSLRTDVTFDLDPTWTILEWRTPHTMVREIMQV